MKTVLITGCSSGFGLETARYFLDRGWNVAATMRTPRGGLLPDSEQSASTSPTPKVFARPWRLQAQSTFW